MKKVAVFDLDGTLIDSLQGISLACNAALRLSGLPEHETEEYRTFIGNGMDKLIWRALPAEADEKTFLQVKRDYDTIYCDVCAHGCPLFDGVAEMLEELHRHVILTAAVSNKPHNQTRAVVQSSFGALLDLAQGQREGVPLKPDPQGVRQVLEKLEGCCVSYTGDSEVDMETGKNGGFYTIGVTWGMKEEGLLRRTGADAIAHTVEQLKQLILAAAQQ